MENNRIVTITRQFGSGGKDIGKALAADMGVPFFDRDDIDDITAGVRGIEDFSPSQEVHDRGDGFWHNLLAVLGTGGSIDGLSFNHREFMDHEATVKRIASHGPCVLCGRCADYVLRDTPGVTSVFVYAEMEDRMKRVIEDYGLDEKDAKSTILILDKARENYYNYHTGQKWGEAVNYHLSIDSGYISQRNIIKFIEDYVDLRLYG